MTKPDVKLILGKCRHHSKKEQTEQIRIMEEEHFVKANYAYSLVMPRDISIPERDFEFVLATFYKAVIPESQSEKFQSWAESNGWDVSPDSFDRKYKPFVGR